MLITPISKTYTQISFTDVKTYLGIDETDTSQDSLIYSLIYPAIQICEKYIDDDIVTTVNSLQEESFLVPLEYPIYYRILRQNINVVGITGGTGDGGPSTIYKTLTPTIDFQLEKSKNFTSIHFKNSFVGNILLIQFTGGYTSVPYDIQLAIKMKVAEYYDAHRNGFIMTNTQQINAFERLLRPHLRELYD